MSNILDTIADGIANAISGTTTAADSETPLVEKALPATTEPKEAIGVSRGFGDLKRFLLPSFKNRLYPGLGPFDGSSNLVGRFWPRMIQDAINVIFPDPIYGIWLDPTWTSPGMQVGVAGSGANRGSYTILHRGDGIKYTEPVSNLNVLNFDGLEQVYSLVNQNLLPYGYISFLIATSKESASDVRLNARPINVSSCIHSFALTVTSSFNVPSNGAFNVNFNMPLVAAQGLKRIHLNINGLKADLTKSDGGYCASIIPWYLSTLTSDASVGPTESVDVLGPLFGGIWTKGKAKTISCMSSRAVYIPRPNEAQNAHATFDIPPGTYAVTFGLAVDSSTSAVIFPESDTYIAGNTGSLNVEVHGE